MYLRPFIKSLGRDLAAHGQLNCDPTTMHEDEPGYLGASQSVRNELAALASKALEIWDKTQWEALDVFTTEYKVALSACCASGRLPDVILGVPTRAIAEVGSAHVQHRVLNFLSWPSKLTFAGESKGTADFAGFLERSRECEHRVDDSRALPIPAFFRQWLYQVLPAPSLKGKPRHGPGATYEKAVGWDKWLLLDTKPRCVMRMSSVPKDRNKRRLIGIEPTALQFIQQGLASELRVTEYFRRYIDIESQHNHVMFALGSTPDRRRVTVDMSDASDRISTALVEHLFPQWYPFLACASSSFAEIRKGPQKGLHRIGMMANMGCGFCFELETLVFHAVATLVGCQETGLPPSSCAARVRVYGDDIILPETWLPEFERVCARLGWVINPMKTAVTHEFLETCGHYICPDQAVTTRRYCPSLETVDKGGIVKALSFQSQAQKLAFALITKQCGFPQTAATITRALWLEIGGFEAIRWNCSLHRHELRRSALHEITRILSVTEETRLRAYWQCGLVDQREEGTGRIQLRSSWVPLTEEEQTLLEESVPAYRTQMMDVFYDDPTVVPKAKKFVRFSNAPLTQCDWIRLWSDTSRDGWAVNPMIAPTLIR